MSGAFVPRALRGVATDRSPLKTRRFACRSCGNRNRWLGVDDSLMITDLETQVTSWRLEVNFETDDRGTVILTSDPDDGHPLVYGADFTRIFCRDCQRLLWVARTEFALACAARDLLLHESDVSYLPPAAVGELLPVAATVEHERFSWLIERALENARAFEVSPALLARFLRHENAHVRSALALHLGALQPFVSKDLTRRRSATSR